MMDFYVFIYMENINGYVYLLIDKRNGKKYIGKHNGKKKNYFSGGIIPNRIIKLYGVDVFEKIILEDNIENDNDLLFKEKYYIEKYDTFNEGYNLTIGGDGGGSWIYQKTTEEKERIKELKRKFNLGRTFSKETLKKMSDAKKGKPLSEEHKKNIRKSQSGENHPWFGKHHTDKTKKKISESRIGITSKKHSEFMKKNNPMNKKISINSTIFDSISEAVEKLGIKRHIIKKKLNSNEFPNWVKL